MLYPAVRPLLFRLDPERAHRLALQALAAAGRLPARAPGGAPVELMGLHFPNRVGLAAGFDKNAEAVDGIGRFGFGFIEVGTVTPRPQRGQPPPRLFRHPRAGALVNRLGFPNDGAAAVAGRLRRRRYRGVLGVNVGKNADTPIDRALDDYVACLRALHDAADYVALNISSPNTAALRDLHQSERLEPLLSGVLAERERLVRRGARRLPLLLKVSPDLEPDALREVARVAAQVGVDGLVATNTTVRRAGVPAEPIGGLSGRPLHPLALAAVTRLRELVGPRLAIVGVGGIDSVAKAVAMRTAGADLVQVYTGFVYRGPALVARLARSLQ
ncbi:MAG TPA: quinone-dependent dihydroorotate dehydrogenase [Gammaproteobacteria bacterium]|nr:quinone-dependent dihydroorotate dehydrogenase [Gammaproteobacteria bacterium]